MMPEVVHGVNGKNIYTSDIPLENNVAEILSQI
jgi:hypothetical protein